jgi:hypothetical protein
VRSITEVLKNGEWAGEECFIVGSGPSLKGFDYSNLSGRRVIACNEAYRNFCDLFLSAINIVQDPRLFKGEEPFVKGFRDREDWFKSGAWPVYVKAHPDQEDIEANDFIFQAHTFHSQHNLFPWSTSLKDGLVYGANVGLVALSLADILGASPIYLLGFDCGYGPKRETHCHENYPDHWKVQNPEIYRDWIKMFAKYSPKIKGKVVVCGPSGIECFRKISHNALIEELMK